MWSLWYEQANLLEQCFKYISFLISLNNHLKDYYTVVTSFKVTLRGFYLVAIKL